MAGRTKISDPSAVVGGRWCGMPSAWKATMLAAALVVGGSIEALAQDPPDPAKDKVWGGCVLGGAGESNAVGALIEDIQKGVGINGDGVTVSFVVVYTLANNNNGQPLTTPSGAFTGPIICRNPDAVDITAEEADGDPLRETSDIPDDTGPADADDVNIRSAEEVFVLQYQLNGGANDGDTENRFCHTTDANVDCFRIFGAPVIP